MGMNLSLEQIAALLALTQPRAKTVAAMYALSSLSGFETQGTNIPAMKAYIDSLVALKLVRHERPELYEITAEGLKALERSEIMLSELQSSISGAIRKIKLGGKSL